MVKLVIFAVFVTCCCVATASRLLGSYSDVDVKSEDALQAAKFATKVLGRQFNTSYQTKLARIHKAEKQIVAGRNFRLTITIGLTTCQTGGDEYDSCEFQDNDNTYRKCNVVVYQNLNDEYELSESECTVTGKNEI